MARDIEQSEGLGLVKTRLEPDPGHGKLKLVIASANVFHLVAEFDDAPPGIQG